MIGKLFRLLLDSILPRRCRKCGQILTIEGELCEKCLNELNFIFPPYCRKCGHPLSEKEARGKMLCASCLRKKRFPFRLSRSALCYDEASKNLILAFKFMDRTENARLLAAMLKVAGEDIFKAGVDVIVPVPLHYTRLVKRRYNQAALLARELGRYTGLPVDCFSLVRHRKTRPQVEFSGFERVRNVKNAFSVPHPEKLAGKRVVLIDDVLTTGSTLKECAAALKEETRRAETFYFGSRRCDDYELYRGQRRWRNEEKRVSVYPGEYFCPCWYTFREKALTENTVAVHWNQSSWWNKDAFARLRASLKPKLPPPAEEKAFCLFGLPLAGIRRSRTKTKISVLGMIGIRMTPTRFRLRLFGFLPLLKVVRKN